MTARRVVVVGAGTAGSVVAARLSEQDELDVVVCEAGSAHWSSVLDGRSFFDALAEPGRTWRGLTASRATGQPPTLYVRGRGVGGSSSVNAMVGLRPTRDDLARWASLGGWGNELADVRIEIPLAEADPAEFGPLAAAVLDEDPAARAAPLSRDPQRRRASSYSAYLHPASSRPTLTLRGNSLVDRVLFDGRRACGVLLAATDGGAGIEIEADAVVVCAGAIHSPAVLLRSGVETAGVGDNLQDHPSFPVVVDVHDGVPADALPVSVLVQFSHAGAELQLLPVEFPGTRQAHLVAAVMSVHSAGTVRLAGPDPRLDPIVEFGMLADPRDERAIHAAVDRAESLLDRPRLRAVGTARPIDRSALRAGLGDYVHAAGTCAMGSVVDHRLAVHGYSGLYVCDTSVMPCVPTVNTYLPAVIIAERFSEVWKANPSAS